MTDTVPFPGKVPVVLFQDEGMWFAHCAALEITGYGRNEQEARESFEVMLDEFFRYTTEEGTLHSELRRMGWQVEAHTPPPFGALVAKDELLRRLFDTKPVRTVLEPIPAYS